MMTVQMSESRTLESTPGPPAPSRLGAQRCLDDAVLRANPRYHHSKSAPSSSLPAQGCPSGAFLCSESGRVGLWTGIEGAAAGAGHHPPPGV